MSDFVSRRSVLTATLLTGIYAALPAWARPTATVTVRRGYADGRFGQLHYRIAKPQGEAIGRPVLFFHSSPNSGVIFESVLAHLGSTHMAIAVDTPGFGESDPPREPPQISDYAGAMSDFISAMGLQEVDVVGYHTGSKIAVQLALDLPNVVKKAILISAPIYKPRKVEDFEDGFRAVELKKDGSHLVEKWQTQLKWAMPGWTMDQIARQFPEIIRRPDISWWGFYAALQYDMGEHLAQLKQPVLVLNPEDDIHELTSLSANIVGKQNVRDLPGWSLGFLDVHSQDVANMIKEFFNQENDHG